jgi:uncharacterized protein (TIGR02594 family)
MVSTGKDDPGGVSYGRNQLSTKDSMPAYLRAPESAAYRDQLKAAGPVGSPAFNQAYKDVAARDPDGFQKSQNDFLMRTHYDPVKSVADKQGFDTNSRAVQQALFSTSVQHGRAADIVRNAGDMTGKTPQQQINALYDARTAYTQGLPNLPDNTKASVINRFGNERNDALAIASSPNDKNPFDNNTATASNGSAPATSGSKPATGGTQVASNSPVAPSNHMDIARSMVGKNSDQARQDITSRGGKFNNGVWCADFANDVLKQSGQQGSGSSMAKSFLNVGTKVDASEAKNGDIVVFNRGAPGSASGHVGFVDRVNPDGSVRVLGGNQGGQVSIKNFPASQVVGFRRIDGAGTGTGNGGTAVAANSNTSNGNASSKPATSNAGSSGSASSAPTKTASNTAPSASSNTRSQDTPAWTPRIASSSDGPDLKRPKSADDTPTTVQASTDTPGGVVTPSYSAPTPNASPNFLASLERSRRRGGSSRMAA